MLKCYERFYEKLNGFRLMVIALSFRPAVRKDLTSLFPPVTYVIMARSRVETTRHLTSYFPMLLKNIMLTDPNSFRNNHLPEPE